MKILGTLAFLALGLAAASAPASAATICNGCDYSGSSQYLGVHDPLTGDQSTYVHNNITVDAISDLWVFDISPAGLSNLTATFNPTNTIANFKVELFATTNDGTCLVQNASCAVAPTLGASLGSNSPGGFAVALQDIFLTAGRYAFVISGTRINKPGQESYSGNLNVNAAAVPEPVTLSLLGVGLAMAARRRRRSA
jgi:hypothetical protein